MKRQLIFILTSALAVTLFAASGSADGSKGHATGSAESHAEDGHNTTGHGNADAGAHGDGAQDGHGESAGKDHHKQGQGESGAHSHEGATFSVGEPADVAEADRMVRVVMSDAMTYTFTPDFTSINDGEVIQFEVFNEGKINHEFSVGNQEDQIKHAAMMTKMPNMTHDDPNTVTVQPNQSKSLVWRFKGEDGVVFACNIPGHYQAGMFKKAPIVETVVVEDGRGGQSR